MMSLTCPALRYASQPSGPEQLTLASRLGVELPVPVRKILQTRSATKAHLNKLGRLQGVKGDPLKKNALDLLDAAQAVLNRGVALWTSKTKS